MGAWIALKYKIVSKPAGVITFTQGKMSLAYYRILSLH